ncbi:coiled-coil domain-containing protein 162 [Archocentrus centrarchus]|uniref:coiled-coil domain-containing protein 162 n=1 Tax=Archocentrus centrarchus TaxID=63155 RepID=UPI0011EA1873|nr:coiled-coil domain-containing protein 162-like [Archocentrus centrarchus]
MNAARGGKGEAEGLGSLKYIHNTPVDYKVHCSEFMEFAEVQNLHDFYTSEGHFIHTQDHRGFSVMYDAALQDLAELMNELLLISSHFIHRNAVKQIVKTDRTSASTADIDSWAGTDVDRVAVLLDLWTCETEFLDSKVQLLNCYYEAYQHAAGTEERFALAQVITDIMHRRPQLDLNQDYFVRAFRAEIDCMQSHQQLIRYILDNQIERQRLYLQRIWRNDCKSFLTNYGRPPNYVPQYVVSLGGSRPALMNVFLLEVHPSLCLASAVYEGLVQAHTELCQLHRATSITAKLHLEQKLLEQALQSWNNLTSAGASYSSQIQKDLFSGVFIEDPILVQKVGLSLVKSAEESDVMQEQEKQLYAMETLSKLLELVTVRHRLLESASETAHLAQEAFLSSGDVTSYQSVSDNMTNALPLLSSCIRTGVFSLMLPVPRPLENQSCQAQMMYPWRSFIACHGLLPLHIWDVPPIEYCVQLCLSGLSNRSRLQANAAILGVSQLTEDVLSSSREAEPVRLHGNKDDLQHGCTPNEVRTVFKCHNSDGNKSCTEDEERKTDFSVLQEPIRIQSVLKGFLLLTKQLGVFRESWARRRLGIDVFDTPALYQQFVKLYRGEIFYPSMRALAKQMGKEHHYEVLISGSQSLLPPPGAAEVDVKAWQLHLLMESTECDMIRALQKKISRELTLVLSERTQPDNQLPTELWKRSQMKYSLSPERPQMVETFIQQLMQGAEQADGELKVSRDHLQQCLAHLGSSLMERERHSFLLYSQFYEQILQQHTQLLYQKEQDLKSLKDTQMSNAHKEVANLCRGMMLEISGLQAQVAHLEEEKRTLEDQFSLKFKERYNPLVQHLFSTCIQLKARLDEYPRQMERDMSVMVNRVRGEGVDKIIKLKKTYGCTKDNDGLNLTQLKKEEVHELNLENSRLTALLCKLRALRRWRQVVDQEKLHRQLLQTKQREVTTRIEALRVKMLSEEKVVFLQEELDFAQQALTRCQAECSSTKKLLSRKMEELQVARHRSAQESRSRQELDSYRVQTLEQMRADVEDRDRQLRVLGEQLDRGSRINRLERQRSAKEIRQVRGQLQQERSFKQEAFQQLDKLHNQVNGMEVAPSRRASTTGQSRTYSTLSVSRLSTRSPSAGLHWNSQHSALQLGSLTNYTAYQDFATEPRQQRAEIARGHSNPKTNRSKADLCRLHLLTAEALFPKKCSGK